MTASMKRMSHLLSLMLPLMAVIASAAEPADPPPKGPEFELQGEYTGELDLKDGKQKVGAQVIALGSGKFHIVGYDGGLPGDGWNGDDKHEVDGQLNGTSAEFKTDGDGHATLTHGVLSVSNGDRKLGELRKTERTSSTLGAKPPAGAIVLFDGTNADQFEGGKMTADGLLVQGCTSKKKFQNCTVHLEFRTPFMPEARGQGRGNSGCYLQGRYEVQVLDSFGLKGENNECGGIYTIGAPKVNMCYPPFAWQTYDIDYTAAKFEAGKKIKSAKMTVNHNGVTIHENVELTHATTAAPVGEGPEPGPLYLQDHGNPVRYRNIWVVEK